MFCFTHFQVMPEFIDFLLPFGFREYAHDFQFSGFRQRTQLIEGNWNISLSSMPKDKKFQICWNLKAIEPSDSDEWSIRQCAICHSFDLKQVRTSWIIVKGNELMKRRIESATSNQVSHGMSNFDSLDRAFEASLETHLIFCRWSTENWRWYINSLEDRFQSKTRRAFSAPLHVPVPPTPDTDQFALPPRTYTERTFGSKSSRFRRTETQMSQKGSLKLDIKHRTSALRTYTNPDTGISQPLPPEEDDDDDDKEAGKSLKPTETRTDDENREFSFDNLRKLHRLAEKANEAVLTLKQNIVVLTQLRQYYRSISSRQQFPEDLAEGCKDAIDNFELCIKGLEHDMQIQILRLEALLHLMNERKTLVKQIIQMTQPIKLKEDQLHSILDYQNTRANKYSTRSMHTMTEDMNDIARKTKVETVSMKVITLVTLFFLPGTFISVGHVSLLMRLVLLSMIATCSRSTCDCSICIR